MTIQTPPVSSAGEPEIPALPESLRRRLFPEAIPAETVDGWEKQLAARVTSTADYDAQRNACRIWDSLSFSTKKAIEATGVDGFIATHSGRQGERELLAALRSLGQDVAA